VIRHECERPGELLHLETKKLGRIEGIEHRITGRHTGAINRHHGIGWEHLHVCIDDASRLPTHRDPGRQAQRERRRFLKRALAWFARHGVTAEGVMTDNGSAYISRDFQAACRNAGLKHLRTQPYAPRTNGKGERFIQSVLRECAYARPFSSSQQRADALPRWTHLYNTLPAYRPYWQAAHLEARSKQPA
jgi:transposase InsO family protein